jgi:flagellar hook assembly protein FlgD
LPQAGAVTIGIYNVNGQLVQILVDEEQTSGAYRVSWNGQDLHGFPAASGIYFCQLKSGQFVDTIKMILLR